MFDIFTSPNAWMALLTLTFLEIFISIDNITFISFAADKLEKSQQKKAIYSGLVLAAVVRILLLIGITLLLSIKKPFWVIDLDWISGGVSVQSLILFTGGLFLLYKSTKELREKVEDRRHDEYEVKRERSTKFAKAIVQIVVINMVFSLDSVLAAVGMTNSISSDPNDALVVMLLATLISLLVMILLASTLNNLVKKHPSIKVLGLSFLMLIGFVLIADAAHVSHVVLFNEEAINIPKGYLYFAIIFSVLIAFIELVRTKGSTADLDD